MKRTLIATLVLSLAIASSAYAATSSSDTTYTEQFIKKHTSGAVNKEKELRAQQTAQKKKIEAAKKAREEAVKAQQKKIEDAKKAREEAVKAQQKKIEDAKKAREEAVKAQQKKIEDAKKAQQKKVQQKKDAWNTLKNW